MFGVSRIKQHQASIESDGFNQAAHCRLGEEYLKEGRYMEAGAKFRRAVELNPEYLAGWRGLGEAYRLAGVAKEADAAWRTGADVSRRLGNAAAAADFDGLLAGLG